MPPETPTSLAAGTRLARYEILGLLGADGIGQVYRARDKLLKIAVPLADAVSTAHARGITHRDLKPANVMVTADGQVKVLDFGLAKLLDVSAAADRMVTEAPDVITGQGRILGTIAYMSPEQAEGKTVDGRSDIFSLGVMLYEMATGERPFKGDTSLSTLTAIMRETPTSVTEINPAIPKEWRDRISRSLALEGAAWQSPIRHCWSMWSPPECSRH